MKTIPLDISMLKIWLKDAWMGGDYAHFDPTMAPGAREFFVRLEIAPGAQLLDVGCGAGQLALLAATAGAHVTGIDIAPNVLDQARKRAKAQGLTIQFDEGDVEAMPYKNDSFDVVVSLFSAMFAAQPQRAASEMMRVIKPGGRLIMANWTLDGFVGQMAKVIARQAPPPPVMTSPFQWGDEGQVRARLPGLRELLLTPRVYPLHFPFPPVEVVAFFRKYYGPVNRAFDSLDRVGQASLQLDLEHFWTEKNLSENKDATHIEAAYLEVDAVKA
jgi:SAM-dependent methyltransferase